jgi:Uma2 family endonuclease
MASVGQPFAEFPDFLPLRRFSTADYLEMIDKGVLGPDDHVELIAGMIVEMSPAGIPHNGFLIGITNLFSPLLKEFEIAIQGTLTLAEGHVYDPDFMLLRRWPDRYKMRLPEAADVELLIEAAGSSLPRDQKIKLPVYAAAGIPEYWIADLERQVLIVHRELEGGRYKSVECHGGDDRISPLRAPQFSFAVRQLFE